MRKHQNFLQRQGRKFLHQLPVAEEKKKQIKNALYNRFGFLVKNTEVYKLWKSTVVGETQFQNDDFTGLSDMDVNQYIKELFDRASEHSRTNIPINNENVELKEEDIKYIAFYLPQFHPIPQNDEWWGRGFTEWTNVSKAVPQFVGHYQPHLPGELGFYDLRLEDVQKRQIELANKYGIHGFCFHHYWFGGKRLLEKPVNQLLANKELDIPFCLCWANENWTRRWDGLENDVLMAQNHSPEDDLNFIKDIEPALRDSRYIRINGRPLLVVYRVGLLPEAKATAKRWRDYCKSVGIGDLYLVAAQSFGFQDPREYEFDAAVEFPPHTMQNCKNTNNDLNFINQKFQGTVLDYSLFVKEKSYLSDVPYKLFKTVSPGWDNTARKPNNGYIFHGANPETYKEWLSDVTSYTLKKHAKEEQIVFINAWNEWAEGAHLEPDRKYGYGYLQSTSEVLHESRNNHGKKKILVVSHDAHFHGAQILALNIAKRLKEVFGYEVHIVLKSGGYLEDKFIDIGKVYNLETNYKEVKDIRALFKKLYYQGVEIGICNTVVTGDLVEILDKEGIRVISLVHELPGVIKQFNIINNARALAKYATKVVFPSNYVKDKFNELIPIEQEKAITRPQGLFHTNKFKNSTLETKKTIRERIDIPLDSKIVLGVGYADYRKGVDLFIEVANRVCIEQEDVYFIWIGNKDINFTETLEKMLEEVSCPDRIIFLPTQDDITAFYVAADVFLMTSREDPFPCVVLEAMDASLPVVGFKDAGGFQDVVAESTGILVPYLDVEKMSRAIYELLSDSAMLKSKGEMATKLIDNNYRFSDYIYTLLSLLGHNYKKLSVVVPNYNYERYLSERLSTVTNQTYPIYEIICLDDSSTDNSLALLLEIQSKNSVDIKILPSTTNSGSVFKQWAKGINNCAGEYIWIAEADDLAKMDFAQKVIDGFEQDEDVILSYCQSKQIDGQGTITANDYLNYTNDINLEKWLNNYLQDGKREIEESLAVKNTIPNVSAVIFKKHNINKILAKLMEFKIAGDWYFYVWLLQRGKVYYVAEALNLHRRHKESVTTSHKNRLHYDEIVHMQEYIINNFQVPNETKRLIDDYRKQVSEYLGINQ